ncbi:MULTISPECIES: hypothetical protein [Ehrlichia]|uniref:Uncharacterized protein n=1 Tax=Ehrlichia cf. muris str. EmCRT TaxID=1359167 RepID=A0A0F3NFG0_9RICK|nr:MULTISPECIES: hypothetical protein [Ehrlichia]KJV65624.1 hypothetical protein EMUCRT_0569 [Ehrlichia cf. muris str. EmCRT]OUC04425.1 hypothetical protein DB91_02865 [Ehrlichia sp. Wisconsin_h]
MLNNSNSLVSYVERNLSNHNTSVMDITFDYPIDNNESFPRDFNNIGTGKDDFFVAAIIAFYLLTVVVVAGVYVLDSKCDIMRRNGYTKRLCRTSSMLERAETEQEVFAPIISDNIKQ